MDRRTFLSLTGGALAVACRRHDAEPTESPSAPKPAASAPIDPKVVRIASVKTAIEGGLLPHLVSSFEAQAHMRVEVSTGEMVYTRARAGGVDLVISHFGHKEIEDFIVEGRGEFPRTVFSNQMALLGPPNDPAGVRGLADAGEAFRRIANAKHPYILNDLDGVRYLTEILWNAAGRPARGDWFIDDEASRAFALQRASERGGYVLWGLTPFIRTARTLPVTLEPLVLHDPLFQRMLVSVIVKPGAHPINIEGARAFQSFLLSPDTQAAIRTIHYPGAEAVAWVPAGRHNRTGILPKG